MQIPTLLDNYFQRQADISDIEGNFRCPEDCNAPGCSMTDIIVDVTLFDLIRLSRDLTTRVSHLFSQYCQLGLMVCEDNIRYKRLVIKMKKPCLFLSGNRCIVQGSKPLSCILFPEFYQVKGLLPKLSQKPIFNSFPCLKKPITISENRKNALKKLKKMHLQEQTLSHDYLFGVPSFIVCAKPLTKKLRRRHPGKIKFFLKDYDNILNKTLKASGFFESVFEKISRFDTMAGTKHIFEKLNDRVTTTHLMEKMIRPGVVHKLERHHIKKLKRSLLSPAMYQM
jgi:Fe-S-cluster containining protein